VSLQPGSRLGHYEVLSALGAGGMGEVWRARDRRLDRDVALKVLPEAFVADAERLARFEREAKVLASLNHPHIGHIYGLEEADGVKALVLELVEGPTLADRIARGAIPIDEALPIARQIAEALEAAHEQGIIHRDLKPANIKVRSDGTVKVLDFGLAKALAQRQLAAARDDLSHSPTLTAPMTQMGILLGTAAYMSPEQARGHEVDERADVWAFGCVLFEMLTGRRAFAGSDTTDTLAAILRAEPDWQSLPEATPRLRELIERCLARDLRSRWHAIADVRVEIERAMAAPALTAGGSPSRAGAPWRRALPWALASLGIGALLGGGAVRNLADGRSGPAVARPVRFSFDAPWSANLALSGGAGRVAIAPDGRRIAYLATVHDQGLERTGDLGRQIFVRALGETVATPLPGTEGARLVFFSPDGAWLGFQAGGKLKKVPVTGGAPLDITRGPPHWGLFGADWGVDGTIVFASGVGSGLARVSSDGGTPEVLTVPDTARHQTLHGLPEILPDGHTVLFTIGTAEGSRLARLSLETGQWEELSLAGSSPRYLPPGWLLFAQDGNLRLAPFDLEEGRIAGPVQPVEDGVDAVSVAGLEIATFDITADGDLVFVSGGVFASGDVRHRTQPVWVDRADGEESSLDVEPSVYWDAHLSPDASRFATCRPDAHGIGHVWVVSLDGRHAFPLRDEGAAYNPIWTPDGATLTYTSNGDLFEKLVDEDTPPKVLLQREGYQIPESWSADGNVLAFREDTEAGSRLWTLRRGGEPEPLTDAAFAGGTPRFSPQGGWIAYATDESGRLEVYVRRYPGSERAEPVSRGGGREPVWSRDGRELFYRSGDRMMAVEIRTEPRLAVGTPVELWNRPYFSHDAVFTGYDVAPDGRLLMLAIPTVAEMENTTIHVALDWLAAKTGTR
jgi:hypothetical protein